MTVQEHAQVVEIKHKGASHIYSWPAQPALKLGVLGIDPPEGDAERGVQQTLRKFALEVARPIGRDLDRMTPEAIIAEGSPFWEYRRKYLDLGIRLANLMQMPPAERARLFAIVFEELGYGDGGLAISTGAGILPQYLSALFGNRFLMERFPEEMLGCWAITEPNHGSDTLDPNGMIRHPQGEYGRPGLVAKFFNDRLVLNGQKSAWVSNGPVAEVGIIYCAADTGNGADASDGCVLVIPLDLAGISRGRPLAKHGQVALPQGELFFEDVEVPLDHVLAGPEDYQRALYCIHSEANALMGTIWNGAARSAYDLAYRYAHERRQGGVPIIRHQLTAYRIFHMFRQLEASTALTRRTIHYNQTHPLPALQAAMAVKVTATQTAFDIASEALQLFGGNGLTKEYPLEKILRDCRASLIEDGTNEVLALKGGYYLADPDLL